MVEWNKTSLPFIRVAKKPGIREKSGVWQFRLKKPGIREILKKSGILNRNN